MLEDIRAIAFEAKALYKSGRISRAEAKTLIMPYIEAFNRFSIETAKKYNVKPKKISFAGFVR